MHAVITSHISGPRNADLIASDSPLKDVDVDHMCMYEFFSEYRCEQDPITLNYRMKKRKKPIIVVPTPYFRPSLDGEKWCYQAMMLFTPFRTHSDVLRHPLWRNCRDLLPPMEYIDPDLSVGLPEPTAPADPPPTSEALVEEMYSGEPLDWDDLTPEIAQRMYDMHFAPPLRFEEPEWDGMYPRATILLPTVLGDPDCWPAKYAHYPGVLTAINDHLTQAYLEANTVPEQADLLNALAQMGVDPEGPFCVEEMLAALQEQLGAGGASRLPNAPAAGAYVGPQLSAALQKYYEDNKPSKKATSTAPSYPDPHADLRTATAAELVALAEGELRSILGGSAPYESCALRQRMFLSVVMEAVVDVIKVDNGIPCPAPRTCRMILQGEAGTGKSYVLKIAVDLCCKYLQPRAVKVFAPTAFAAKVYEECPCGSTTFASVWKKGYASGSKKKAKSSGRCKTGNMPTDTASAMKLEMEPVRALICDEMSMLSPNDIAVMHNRLSQAFGISAKVRV